MYYYKHMDDNGELVSVETREIEAVDIPNTMEEITQTEYDEIIEELRRMDDDVKIIYF